MSSRDEESYPPDTYRWTSWSALRFIQRPSFRPLAWICYGVLGTLAAGLAATFFISQDSIVEAPGEIVSDPGILRVVAAADGLMGVPEVPPGTVVAAGEVLGLLQMELDERQVETMLASLSRDVALIERADPRTGLPTQLLSTLAPAAPRDDEVREAVAALQAAVGRSTQGVTDAGQFEAFRGRAIEATHRLSSVLVGYLERHRLRAPGPGVVLQYDASPGENVRAGQPVATVLPEGARLVARLILRPRYVPDIAPGQPVRHRVEAYPYQRYGVFEGEVISIQQAAQGEGSLAYEVRTTVRQPPTLSPELAATVRLVTGIKTASDIVTGRRTLYELAMDSFFGR